MCYSSAGKLPWDIARSIVVNIAKVFPEWHPRIDSCKYDGYDLVDTILYEPWDDMSEEEEGYSHYLNVSLKKNVPITKAAGKK